MGATNGYIPLKIAVVTAIILAIVCWVLARFKVFKKLSLSYKFKTRSAYALIAVGILALLLLPILVLHDYSVVDTIAAYCVGPVMIAIAIILLKKFKKEQIDEALGIHRATQTTDYGSAKWSSINEFKSVNTGQDEPKGYWLSEGFIRSKWGHFATVAPSGQGKSSSFVIPNLLIEPVGSYVITDPKGEIAFITASAQKNAYNQRVFILDPWNEQGRMKAKHGLVSSGFNPFDFLKSNMELLPDYCDMISYYLLPPNPQAKEPFWDDRGRSLIKILLLHIITGCPPEEHNFWTLYKFLRNDTNSLAQLLADLKFNEAYDGLISLAANELSGLAAATTTFASVISNAQNATKIFESPQLRKSLSTSEFNPFDLADGNCTVYIVIPDTFMESHAAWLRMVIGLSLKAVNAKPNKRVTFLLDEFPYLGKMNDVVQAYAIGRSKNIAMWVFMQSLSQLKLIYGEDGMNAILSNVNVFQAFGLQDEYSKEFVSKMLGNTTRTKATTSFTDSGPGQPGSTSYGSDSYDFPLLTPDEVGRFPHIITVADKIKYPVVKQPYYKSLTDILRASPGSFTPNLTGKTDKWYELFISLADPPPMVV